MEEQLVGERRGREPVRCRDDVRAGRRTVAPSSAPREEPQQRPGEPAQHHRDPGQREDEEHERDEAERHHDDDAVRPGVPQLLDLHRARLDGLGHHGRQVPQEPAEGEGQRGHHEHHPSDDEASGRGPELSDPWVGRATRHGARQGGPQPREQVRHPDQVREDVVAVEPHDGDELLDHLHVHDEDREQQDPVPGQLVAGAEQQQEQHVEVEPAEVGSHASRPAEPVGVGDVGEEGREHQIDPEADRARDRAAVPARRGVTELVEERPAGEQGVEHEQLCRCGQQLLERRQQVGLEDQHQVEGDPGKERRHHHGWQEEPAQSGGEDPDGPRREDGAAQRQRQQRSCRGQVGAVRPGRVVHQSEGLQPTADQMAEPGDGEGSPVRCADRCRDLLLGPVRIQLAEDQVEELGHLDDLAVGAAHQVVGGEQRRPLDRTEILQSGRGPQPRGDVDRVLRSFLLDLRLGETPLAGRGGALCLGHGWKTHLLRWPRRPGRRDRSGVLWKGWRVRPELSHPPPVAARVSGTEPR